MFLGKLYEQCEDAAMSLKLLKPMMNLKGLVLVLYIELLTQLPQTGHLLPLTTDKLAVIHGAMNNFDHGEGTLICLGASHHTSLVLLQIRQTHRKTTKRSQSETWQFIAKLEVVSIQSSVSEITEKRDIWGRRGHNRIIFT